MIVNTAVTGCCEVAESARHRCVGSLYTIANVLLTRLRPIIVDLTVID